MLSVSALLILASCAKDDETGIPPVTPQPQGETPNAPSTEIVNASDIDDAYYQSKKNQKVSVKGNIVIDGGKSHFKLKDNTLIQIFAHTSNFNALSQETKDKLKINGQEITVTGTFTDFTDKAGKTIKEIVYTKETDLVFGTAPSITYVELEASNATATDYTDGKAVKLHGNIVVQGGKSYFKFKDDILIQIYAPKNVFDALSDETKKKLVADGQELTVIGTFTDYKDKNNNIIKEIVYNKEADLVFGTTPPSVTPTPEVPIDIDATTTNLDDVFEKNKDKAVKVKGVISVDGNRSWIAFKDGKKVQLYITGFNSLKQETRDKLNTPGQEVTIIGKFGVYSNTQQLQVAKEADITFGKTPDSGSGSGSSDSGGSTSSNKFDFENLTKTYNQYNQPAETINAPDGTKLTFQARTDVKGSEIEGKGLMFRRGNDNNYIKLEATSNLKQITFQVRGAASSKAERIISIFNGDENSTTLIKQEKFKYEGSADTKVHTFTIDVSNANTKVITFKIGTAATDSRQLVIDNITWTK